MNPLKMFRRKAATYKRLSPISRATFWRCLFLIPVSGLILSLLGYNRCLNLLSTKVNQTSTLSFEEQQTRVFQVQAGFKAALRYLPYRGTCLSRSLLLQRILHQHGSAVKLKIGVNIKDGETFAHAWLEFNGETVHTIRDLDMGFKTLSLSAYANQPGE